MSSDKNLDLSEFKQTTLTFVYHIPFYVNGNHVRSAHPAIGRYVDSLAGYFSEVIIVAPRKTNQDKMTYRLEASNIRVFELPTYRNIGQFWFKAHHYYIKLFRAAADWDLLHIRLPTHFGFPAYLAARRYRKPVFLVVVGEGLAYSRFYQYSPIKQLVANNDARLQDFFTRIMVRRCLTFTNGEDLFHKLNRPGRQVYLMRSSTISEAYLSSPEKDTCQQAPYRILTVATIAPRKGTALIPEVLFLLNRQGIQVEWSYVGHVDGNAGKQEMDQVLARAIKFGVDSQLHFQGPLRWETLQSRYRSSDLFVLPTYMEGIPRVILEAQAAGLPVITTPVGGIPQAVRDGVDAILVNPGDPVMIAETIKRVVQDSELRRNLIINGLKSARQYSIESETRRMVQRVKSNLYGKS